MTKKTIRTILRTLQKNLEVLSEKEIEKFINGLNQSKRIFIIGAGRSGLVGRAFGMRLMHLDFNVFVVGDTITPAIEKGDTLLAISGSGETSMVRVCAEVAKRKKAKILAITGNLHSSLGKIADISVKIPINVKAKRPLSARDYYARELRGTTMPLGTPFELAVMIFCDSIITELMKRNHIDEREMKKRHTNLE